MSWWGVGLRMCELGSVFEFNNVPRLRRRSILCNSLLIFFFQYQDPFCLKRISSNAAEAVFFKYVACICAICLEVFGPNL